MIDVTKNVVIWETWNEAVGTSRNVVASADAATFEIIDVGDRAGFGRDKNHIYLKGKPVAGADPKSFEWLSLHKESGEYYRDARHVFRYSDGVIKTLAGSDPELFTVINSVWSRDAKRVYLFGTALVPKDIDSFEPLMRIWARDDLAYYYGVREITEADRSSFTISGADPMFARDREHVFWHGWIIEGCNPDTFRIESPNSGSDDRFRYRFREIWGGNDASFQKIKVDKQLVDSSLLRGSILSLHFPLSTLRQ